MAGTTSFPALKSESTEAAAAIIEKFELAQRLRDKTIATASAACRAACDCGDLLIEQKERHKGQFLAWLSCNCPTICRTTAWRYMTIARLRRELGPGTLDFKNIRKVYALAGIIPPNSPIEERAQIPPYALFWCYARKLDMWFPNLPENQRPRVREWWTRFGRERGWLT